MGKKSAKEDSSITSARISARATIVVALIALVGTLIALAARFSRDKTNAGCASLSTSGANSPITQVQNASNVSVNNNFGSTTVNNATERDYVEGTQVTHQELQNTFPFGYVVIRLRNGKWAYEPDPTGGIDVRVDWSHVVVDPDFATGKVHWTIPGLSYAGDGMKVKGANSKDNTLYGDVTLEPGKFFFIHGIFFDRRQPMPLVSTLNSDQVHPVFCLGFRILPVDILMGRQNKPSGSVPINSESNK